MTKTEFTLARKIVEAVLDECEINCVSAETVRKAEIIVQSMMEHKLGEVSGSGLQIKKLWDEIARLNSVVETLRIDYRKMGIEN